MAQGILAQGILAQGNLGVFLISGGYLLKVLFLIEGWISPAPRYRVLQYLSYLDTCGINYEVRAMHGHNYPFFYHWRGVGAIYKGLVRFFRRWYHLRDAQEYDVVFCQRISLPHTSWLERRLAKKNPRIIFDYDDAIFQTEAGPDARRMATFKEILAVSRKVIAGSDYLASCANVPTAVIPTVIDTDHYVPADKNDELTLGWMGTASNFPNFTPLLPVLEKVLERFPHLTFHVVSDQPPPFSLPRLRYTRWHKDTEISLLQSFDVGIMPLADSDWNRGKCAFKLIQYMSVGIPVVAGDVGANKEVVIEGETGYLASDEKGWLDGLTALFEDSKRRKTFGKAGRERCVANYSLISARKQLVEVLHEAAGEPL